jgi:hypothetical protein
MRVWEILLTLIVFASAASGATINVVVTTADGEPLTAQIRLFQVGTEKNLWPAGGAQSASGIRPGYYRIEVFKPGFRQFRRDLELGEEVADIRAVLTVSRETSGALDLRGKVVSIPSYTGIWVIIFPLAGLPTDMTEAKVEDGGGFQISTSHSGPYLLAVVRGSEVLHSEPVYIGVRNPELVINLGRH